MCPGKGQKQSEPNRVEELGQEWGSEQRVQLSDKALVQFHPECPSQSVFNLKLGMEACTCNTRIWEAEVEES